MANYLKESIVIRPCQVSKVDQLDKNDILEILDKTVHNQEWIIKKSRQLSETKVDVANIRYKIDNNNLVGAFKLIRKEIAMEKKLLTPIENAKLGDNPQAYVLCDIIEIRLLLNYL